MSIGSPEHSAGDDRPARPGHVTYVTICDEKFFIGLVGLVNSLRLTGNMEPIVVIDVGLTDQQRAILGKECDIRPPPVAKDGVLVVVLKAAVHLLGLNGIVVLVDSDVIVTRLLTPIFDDAAAGEIVVVADMFRERYFEEWSTVLGLDPPPRRQRHVGAGFIALDLDQWPDFMPRWLELCERIPKERAELPFELPSEEFHTNPFALNEMDVLNALLGTVPSEAQIKIYELDVFPGPPHNDQLRVLDRLRLRCDYAGHTPFLLHYWNHPKPWLPNARKELSMDAYVDLLARLLTSDDVPIRLQAADVPVWLRDDLTGKFVRRAPRQARRSIRAALSLLPERYEQRARDIGGMVAQKVGLG